ncbi:hypothetical protein MASR1M60_26160 [Rhodocyclaceae bacterium]
MAEIAPYLRIAHHVPGRIRLKLDTAAFEQPHLRDIGARQLQSALGALPGVRELQFNPLARSCVVAYNRAVIRRC